MTTHTFTDADLAALQAVAEAATPGPWFNIEYGPEVTGKVVQYTVSCSWPDPIDVAIMQNGLTGEHDERSANAAHIAAFSPATALRLLKEHREMAALLSAAADEIDRLCTDGNVMPDRTGELLGKLYAALQGAAP